MKSCDNMSLKMHLKGFMLSHVVCCYWHFLLVLLVFVLFLITDNYDELEYLKDKLSRKRKIIQRQKK